MPESLTFCGRTFDAGELELMRQTARDFCALGVTEIARTVCELLEWTRPSGGLKNHECRQLLERLSVPFVAPDDSVSSLPAFRASPVSADEKSSSSWIFCCWSSLRLMAYWPLLLVRAFGHRSRLGLSLSPPFRFRSASTGLTTS